jgi:RimJ/RimL family protein N-acetyltransferase
VTAVPVIETERLRLREWRDEDLDAYAALCADPEVMRFLGPGDTMTRAEAAQQVERFRKHWDVHGFGLWCAVARESDECIGFVGLGVPEFLPEVLPAIEIGWRLARASWGHGYASEGARASVGHAFGPLGLDRIVSIAQPANHRSTNVMEKLGMTVERRTVHPEHGYPVVVYELFAPGRSA